MCIVNIGRYENQVIEFDSSSLTLILGENGAGKSTIFDAILYALFGKTSKETSKDDFVTLGADEGGVELALFDDKHEYTIRRFRSVKKQKSEVTFFVDGNDLTGATIDATDSTIEQILHIDFTTFRNSISFAQGEISQFVSGTDKERKDILSSFLNLEIYDKALMQTRNKLNEISSEIISLETQKNNLSLQVSQVEQAEKEIQKIKLLIDQEEKQFDVLMQEMKKNTPEIVVDTTELDQKIAVIEGLKHLRDKIKKFYYELLGKENNLNRIRKELKRIEESPIGATCPTCMRPFTDDDMKVARKQLIKEGNQTKIEMDATVKSLGVAEIQTFEALAKYLEQLNTHIENEVSLRQETSRIEERARSAANMNKIEGFTKNHQIQMTSYASQIARWQTILDNSQDIFQKLQDLDVKISTGFAKKEVFKKLETAFGVNGGIRDLIFENITPILESKINKYIEALSADMVVSLETQIKGKNGVIKEKFAIHIMCNDGIRELRTFSGGEKKIISVGIRLAFSEMLSELANNRCDFLLLDEVASDLDKNKRSLLHKALMQLRQKFSQIFVISHEETLEDLFESRWHVKKSLEGASYVSF